MILIVLTAVDVAYEGDDYPQQWPGPSQEFLKRKHWIPSESSDRFSFRPELADESEFNWNALVPHDGIIYLGEQKRPFSISMFHQLRCLNILRRDIVHRWKSNYTTQIPQLTTHCINYLRQMALCRSDLFLDKVAFEADTMFIPEIESQIQCLDVSLVYDALETNHQEFV